MIKKSNPKIGRRILLFILIFFIYKIFFAPIKIDQEIIIKPGENFQKFAKSLSTIEQFRIKVYLYLNKDEIDLSKIQIGNYKFPGSFSIGDFLQTVQNGPQNNYSRYTVLEGWSIYDIDADLSRKGFIKPGEYISFVTNNEIISKYITRYEFLSRAGNITTLEGFLYPDTYNVDSGQNYIDQLVYLQLDTFNKKVRNKIGNQTFPLDFYKLISLASVVEKEERNSKNKATVAGILLNRIKIGMRIDADITLCYNYKISYETCTPQFIASKLSDSNNPYNTRANAKFVPQPISNPSFETINYTLNYKDTNYMYYLHDLRGNIYYATSLEEHNTNKNRYIK